jgi:hypothetical protein
LKSHPSRSARCVPTEPDRHLLALARVHRSTGPQKRANPGCGPCTMHFPSPPRRPVNPTSGSRPPV